MSEFENRAPEFDRSQFPELIGCKVMPATEEGVTEVEVQDAEGNASIAKVPNRAVRRTNMPLIIQKMKEDAVLPTEIIKEFEEDIAMGLLSCRVVERFEDHGLLRIDLPSVEGTRDLTIDEGQLGHRR